MEINQAAWFHLKIALAVWLAGYGKDPQVLHIETIWNHITRLLLAIRLKPKHTWAILESYNKLTPSSFLVTRSVVLRLFLWAPDWPTEANQSPSFIFHY